MFLSNRMLRALALASGVALHLAACGGGGGGGGGASVAPQFPLGSTPSPTPQVLTALPQLAELNVASATTASLVIGTGAYTSSTPPSPRIGIRAPAGDITDIAVSLPAFGINESFSGAQVQRSSLDGNVVPGAEWSFASRIIGTRAVSVDLIDPSVAMLRYHTFGNWAYIPSITAPTNVTLGYVVLGTPTPAAAVPATGGATYSGVMNAVYTFSGGGADSFFDVTAAASAVADFNARSIAFSTSGTVRQSAVNSSIITPDTSLNITGTLGYAPGSNALSGAFTTGNGLTGTASGHFFGPIGQEIGGTFVLRDNPSTPTAHMFGAFGLHQ